MTWRAAMLVLAAAGVVAAAPRNAPWGPEVAAIAPFSSAAPGAALPTGWRAVTLPRIAPADLALVADGGSTVLRVTSAAAAGSAAFAFTQGLAPATLLRWRWKVDRTVDGADLARREGDDFAARVYVFFDLPLDELTFGERVALRLARFLHGDDVPAAGICYVWDNRHPAGTVAPNPYASRIRTFVLRNAADPAGRWTAEQRDIEADFRAAFGPRTRATPRVSGIAAGNDTDQTGERATAWFGDFVAEARP
jgi:hypothetical protein